MNIHPQILILGLVLALAAGTALATPPLDTPPGESAPDPEQHQLYDRLRPAVVRISAGGGFGSGFVVGDGSLVVTAWHVVSEADSIWIQTSEGVDHEASVERFDRKADVAVLRIEGALDGVEPLALSPDVPGVGDTLFAIGHPLVLGDGPKGRHAGLLEWSLTSGMVSMVGEDQLQTTVSLQPGNSGGPVFDDQGRVVGVAVERQGDFGLARKVDVVADLLATDGPPPKRTRVIPHLAFGIGPSWLPEQGENRRFHFGISADAGVVINRRLMLAVRYDQGFLINGEEADAGRMGRQARFGLMVGPQFSTKPRPFKSFRVRFQPYFYGGLGVAATGTRSKTFEFLDPDCDPGLGPCEYRMDDSKAWSRSHFPMVGGGLRIDLAGAYIDLGATVSPLDPENSFAVGFTFGAMLGRP